MEMNSEVRNSEILGLGNDMIAAAEQVMNLEQHDLRKFVQDEVDRLMRTVGTIKDMDYSGSINVEVAEQLLNLQKQRFRALLLTIKGIREVDRENIANAVMDVVSGAVKRWWGVLL
jgi:hypothetical protein